MNQDGSRTDATSEAELARQAARVHHLLHQLPPRPAPASLARRVRAALGPQPAFPWHRRPWSHWPAPARALSALGLAVAVPAVAHFLAAEWRATAGTSSFLPSWPRLESWDVVDTTWHLLRQAAEGIPTNTWLMVGMIGGLTLASTVGLGAAAWRLAESETE